MHTLQQEILEEIIARFVMRWWNHTVSSKVSASIVCNAVINNIEIFGNVFDDLYSARPKCLTRLLVKALASHGHAARGDRGHRAKLAFFMGRLFHKTADPWTKFVKGKVFGVQNGVPILSEDHPVMTHSQTHVGPVGHWCTSAFICLDVWLVDTL